MKITIISDTHDNLTNLEKFLSYAKKGGIKNLIHCGDVCRVGTLKKVMAKFKGRIFLALGNADLREEILEIKRKRLKIFQESGEVKIGKLRIALCHSSNMAKKLSQIKKYDFVFYGDTHKPWLEKINGCLLVNPGNLAGLYFKASFAVLDTKTKNLDLKILEKI